MFWDDPKVLYVSTRQWPLFPGTGKAEDVGGPNAVGLTVNVPVPRGATGDIVRCAIEEIAHPAIDRSIRPRLGPGFVRLRCSPSGPSWRTRPLHGGLCPACTTCALICPAHGSPRPVSLEG